MRKYYIIIFLLIFTKILYSSWRPYDFYKCGAKGLGTGGAFTGIADDVSAVYWNPAGLVQISKPTLFYNMDAQIRIVQIIDTTLKLTYKFPALLGFVYPLRHNSTVGFSIDTPFQRKIPYKFYVYELSLLYSFPVMRHLYVGIKPSINYGTYGSYSGATGWGWSYQIGILYFMSPKLHFGFNYHSKINIKWDNYGEYITLKETFPDFFTTGVAYQITRKVIMDLDIEYQHWKAISFVADNNDIAPTDNIETGLFKNIHPHLGFMFLEERSGAHLRTGLLTDYYIHDDGTGDTQLLWSIGVGAYAFKIIKFEVSLMDSFLMRLINSKNNRIETIQIAAEYRF